MNREQERSELHNTIWKIAEDLRGSVDGWDFKAYVLGMLFYRFISENLCQHINKSEREGGNTDFHYGNLSDQEAEYGRVDTIQEKGFFILPSELFENVVKNLNQYQDNLNEKLESVFTNIEASAKGAESEDDFKGLFDDIDVNSNKLGSNVNKRNERLAKILRAIAGLRLGDYQDNNNDLFLIITTSTY